MSGRARFARIQTHRQHDLRLRAREQEWDAAWEHGPDDAAPALPGLMDYAPKPRPPLMDAGIAYAPEFAPFIGVRQPVAREDGR